jgi:hypothetical protein
MQKRQLNQNVRRQYENQYRGKEIVIRSCDYGFYNAEHALSDEKSEF